MAIGRQMFDGAKMAPIVLKHRQRFIPFVIENSKSVKIRVAKM